MFKVANTDISRRTVLAGAGALGLASLIYPRTSQAAGSILKVRSYADIQILDPAYRLAAPEGDITNVIFAGLVVATSGDTWGWKPMAVETIEQIDPLTISFKLRDNIGFTDGFGQLTAEDVKFSIERIADPKNESPYSGDWATLKEVEVKPGEGLGVGGTPTSLCLLGFSPKNGPKRVTG